MNHKGLAKTSSKPGKTKTMTAFEIHRGKLLLVDMPGYGHASRQEWGKEIMKYLQNRKQYVPSPLPHYPHRPHPPLPHLRPSPFSLLLHDRASLMLLPV